MGRRVQAVVMPLVTIKLFAPGDSNVAIRPMIHIQNVWGYFESFRRIAETGLPTQAPDCGFRLLVRGVDSDHLYIFLAVLEGVDVL